MNHSFNVYLAGKLGINQAIIIQHIYFWHLKNEGNEKNLINGRYWTYNSIKGYSNLFPYLSEKQIRTAIKSLVNNGYLLTANHNKKAYDRTLWYALTDEGLGLFSQKGKIHLPKGINGNIQKGKPIPDSNTDSNTYIRTNKIEKRMEAFREQVFACNYPQKMLQEFYDYWSEPNKSKTKFKMELQTTWDLKRRLKRWVSNNFSTEPIKENNYDYEKKRAKRQRLIIEEKQSNSATDEEKQKILNQFKWN